MAGLADLAQPSTCRVADHGGPGTWCLRQQERKGPLAARAASVHGLAKDNPRMRRQDWAFYDSATGCESQSLFLLAGAARDHALVAVDVVVYEQNDTAMASHHRKWGYPYDWGQGCTDCCYLVGFRCRKPQGCMIY